MKIKLAILEKDQGYLTKIVSVFSTKYADKFEIYSFTDKEVALAHLEEAKIDVLVANDVFDIDMNILPNRCSFAYFVDSPDIDMKNEQHAICKFQKAELIYKQILSVYSEKAGSVSGVQLGDNNAKILVFNAISGGVGSSSVAAATAMYLATKGKKTLYLNLEKFGSSELFFKAEGQFNMSDIIFALKTKKTNLGLKLESCVKQDKSGVYFYSQPAVALDMTELSCEEILRLLGEIKLVGSYDYIVVDMDFGLDKESRTIYRHAHALVWVGDGSEISNEKLCRVYQALSILEQNEESPLTNRIKFVYNKFSNKTGKVVDIAGIKRIGGAPRFEHATTIQVVEQLASMSMFELLE